MFLYYFAYSCFFILSVLPLSVGVFIAGKLAFLAYHLDKRHREVCRKNILLAFGSEVEDKTIKEISLGAFNNLFLSIIEFTRCAFLSPEKLIENIEFKNKENYIKAKKAGKGVMFLTGHFGSWEIMALAGSTIDPMTIVVRPLDNVPLNKLLLRFRTLYGNQIVPKKNSLRAIIKTLNKGGIVGFLMDQNSSDEEGGFVSFFGHIACTVRAPIEIALRTGAVILPTFITRVSPGKHIIDYGSPIEFGGTGSRATDVLDGLTKFNKVFEDKIRKNPEQWFWMHRRWKTRPPDENKH